MRAPAITDEHTPNCARLTNALLGEHRCFRADREAATRLRSVHPHICAAVRASARFCQRALTFAGESGVRQALDLGAGIPPTWGSVHQAADRAGIGAVVHADHDEVAVQAARAALGNRPGSAALHGDLRDVEAVLEDAGAILDLDRPIVVLLVNVLHHLEDDADVTAVLKTIHARTVPGSVLVIAHGSTMDPRAARLSTFFAGTTHPYRPRTPEAISAMFAEFPLIGHTTRTPTSQVVPVDRWRRRPGIDARPRAGIGCILAGVGRKPG